MLKLSVLGGAATRSHDLEAAGRGEFSWVSAASNCSEMSMNFRGSFNSRSSIYAAAILLWAEINGRVPRIRSNSGRPLGASPRGVGSTAWPDSARCQ
jgi:hypothetical protein